MRKWVKCLCLLLLLALLSAVGGAASASAEKNEYVPVRVYLDGLLTLRGRSVDGQIFLPAEALCARLDMDVAAELDPERDTLTLTAPGLSLFASKGESYVAVNGRYFYNPHGFFADGGNSYLPLELLAQVLNLTAYLSEDGRVDIDLSQAEVIQGGESYYEDTYGKENVFWLGRIIGAEARNQPMAGKIGVGNVVLNRVASEKYPDTVFAVIFDTNNGFQFHPVYNRTIYIDANEQSVIAAYLCFEGYNTVGDSMFFVAPALADDTWFKSARTFVVRIGDHDFYL